MARKPKLETIFSKITYAKNIRYDELVTMRGNKVVRCKNPHKAIGVYKRERKIVLRERNGFKRFEVIIPEGVQTFGECVMGIKKD